MEKTYTLPDGTKFIFEYDHNRMGIITLECMDTLMSLLKAAAEQTEPRTCDTCKFADKEWYEEPCDRCGYMGRYEPKTEPQADCSWK